MSTWKHLPISGEQMEVLAHLSLKREADVAARVRDIWPELDEEDGLKRFADAVDAINDMASGLTGKPGRVIGPKDSFNLPAPEMFIHVMAEEPYVEVR
ncbi:hypothetical protein [Psychromicrobium sp. YIM B11713]|uniref:hypothetical protein n=1 Tax=Psychromicrobium sp. YIM B11713 TaxID=3145233 RepID=UPI00374E3CB6